MTALVRLAIYTIARARGYAAAYRVVIWMTSHLGDHHAWTLAGLDALLDSAGEPS